MILRRLSKGETTHDLELHHLSKLVRFGLRVTMRVHTLIFGAVLVTLTSLVTLIWILLLLTILVNIRRYTQIIILIVRRVIVLPQS